MSFWDFLLNSQGYEFKNHEFEEYSVEGIHNVIKDLLMGIGESLKLLLVAVNCAHLVLK